MIEKDEIIVVGGLPRSGTSLMMKILHKSGLDVIADNYASYEDERTNFITKKDLWLAEAKGKAIKILDLHRQNLPYEFTYKVIWMNRDFKEQAKSNIKFLNLVSGLKIPENIWRTLEKSLIKDEKRTFDRFNKRWIEFKVIRFEDLLYNPTKEFLKIEDFLRIEIPVSVISVIKKRSPECMVGMDIELSAAKAIQ